MTRPIPAPLVIVGLSYAAIAVGAAAQPGTTGRPDFAGTWSLDTYLSDQGEQIAEELRFDAGRQAGMDVFAADAGRGRPGEGGERGRRGGVGGAQRERDRGQQADDMSTDDRKRFDELINAVQFAPPTLTVTQSGDTMSIATGRGTETLQTTGKTEKQSLASGSVDRTASWEGPTLVVRYDVGHAGTLTYTYSIVPTTKQLLVRVNFERVRGRPGPFDVRLVYDRAADR